MTQHSINDLPGEILSLSRPMSGERILLQYVEGDWILLDGYEMKIADDTDNIVPEDGQPNQNKDSNGNNPAPGSDPADLDSEGTGRTEDSNILEMDNFFLML